MSSKKISPIEVAKKCQEYIKQNHTLTTSCIESSFLFERVANNLGLSCLRVVVEAQAFSPKLAKKIADGLTQDQLVSQMTEEGCWSVCVGSVEEPGDYIGRQQPDRNRFVGHVVCIMGENGEFGIIDPSAEQMSRPDKGLVIDEPIYAYPCKNEPWIVTRNKHGVVIRYKLHFHITPMLPKSEEGLTKAAIEIAAELRL